MGGWFQFPKYNLDVLEKFLTSYACVDFVAEVHSLCLLNKLCNLFPEYNVDVLEEFFTCYTCVDFLAEVHSLCLLHKLCNLLPQS